MTKNIDELIQLASSKKEEDLVLKNCRVVNIFTDEITHGNLAIHSGIIVGIGDYKGRDERDMKGSLHLAS